MNGFHDVSFPVPLAVTKVVIPSRVLAIPKETYQVFATLSLAFANRKETRFKKPLDSARNLLVN